MTSAVASKIGLIINNVKLIVNEEVRTKGNVNDSWLSGQNRNKSFGAKNGVQMMQLISNNHWIIHK